MKLLAVACRYLLGAVFLMAAVTKIVDLQEFERQVSVQGDLLPVVARIVIWFLPWLELTCGACLVFGYAQREAALLVGVLLVLFVAHNLASWGRPECGCFLFPPLKGLDGSAGPIIRNLLLLGCVIPLLVRPEATAPGPPNS